MKSRYLTEYDEEKERRLAREEAAMIAHKEGRAEALSEANNRVATDMLKDNYPISAIEKISRLPEYTIRELAQSLEITVL